MLYLFDVTSTSGGGATQLPYGDRQGALCTGRQFGTDS